MKVYCEVRSNKTGRVLCRTPFNTPADAFNQARAFSNRNGRTSHRIMSERLGMSFPVNQRGAYASPAKVR